jgi:hypothetical protein
LDHNKPKIVREQVVVYLDTADRALLEEMAQKTGLARTELFRRGLRRLADDLMSDSRPGASLEYLATTAREDSLPPDVAVRHDHYLHGGGYIEEVKPKRARTR